MKNATYVIEPSEDIATTDAVIDAIMEWASAEEKKVSFVEFDPEIILDVDGQRFRAEKAEPPRSFFGAAAIDGFLAGVKYKVIKLWPVQ
ncbi:hypothetical protein INS90_04985 [Trueperella pecoris]|uniref:Uncharacterized protein n=1 Tax=Trueperella pecoris TaxID=2733571 RepID=A0A7M1R2Q6_9ACTO|nr:hypothetical protein [Trueperella pecoris]QOR48612.1 hypothetical protein INS90_04985 [Trueperella pecoris]